MVVFVVVQVTSLTHRFEVGWVVVLWLVIQMRDGQDNFRSGVRVWLMILCSAAWEVGRAFTAVPGALKDGWTYLCLPVKRIAGFVLRADGHQTPPAYI